LHFSKLWTTNLATQVQNGTHFIHENPLFIEFKHRWKLGRRALEKL